MKQIEYAFSQQDSQQLKLSKTNVYKDVIIKATYSIVSGLRFPTSNIEYKRSDSMRLIVNTNKEMLNQVVYNIVVNSVKYAERDPKEFKLTLEVNENRNNYIIKFKDWGIGINNKYQEKIFDKGFRSPKAKAKNVGGTGLGLFISRSIMRQLGGDLKLGNPAKPTEFHLILPK